MGAVDGAEAIDMVGLGAVEQRPQHRLLVDRIGEHAGVGKARVRSAMALSLQPGQHDAADDVALQHEEDDAASECVAIAAPVMIISHWI